MSGVRITKGARQAIKSARRAAKGNVAEREVYSDRSAEKVINSVKIAANREAIR